MCLLLILLLCVPALHQQSIYWAGTHNNNINNNYLYISIAALAAIRAAAAALYKVRSLGSIEPLTKAPNLKDRSPNIKLGIIRS